MKNYLILLFILLVTDTVIAQNRLCFKTGSTAKSIDFRSEEVNSYLRLDQYKVVIFGEMHNGSFNPEFEYYLLTALNKYSSIRHIFMEMSVSCAWHFNQYLLTGDTAYLATPGLVATYGLWPRFWKRLFDYNSALPDNLKFIFHGTDFERIEVFSTIMALAPKNGRVPSTLQSSMDTVAAHLSDKPFKIIGFTNGKMVEYDNSGFTKTLNYIQSQLLANPEDAKAYFGTNYPVIKDIAENDAEVAVMPKPRNKTMSNTIRRIVKDQKIEKFAGIFGAQHTTYTVHSSITNALRSISGISRKDILNIAEVVYNMRQQSDSSLVQVKDLDKISAVNAGCTASIVSGHTIPGYGKRADYLVIGDASK